MKTLLALILCLTMAACPGVMPERVTTVYWPDGRVEEIRESDTSALEAQLAMLEQAMQMYRDLARVSEGDAKEKAEARAADRAAQAAQLRMLLEALEAMRPGYKAPDGEDQ